MDQIHAGFLYFVSHVYLLFRLYIANSKFAETIRQKKVFIVLSAGKPVPFPPPFFAPLR